MALDPCRKFVNDYLVRNYYEKPLETVQSEPGTWEEIEL